VGRHPVAVVEVESTPGP